MSIFWRHYIFVQRKKKEAQSAHFARMSFVAAVVCLSLLEQKKTIRTYGCSMTQCLFFIDILVVFSVWFLYSWGFWLLLDDSGIFVRFLPIFFSILFAFYISCAHFCSSFLWRCLTCSLYIYMIRKKNGVATIGCRAWLLRNEFLISLEHIISYCFYRCTYTHVYTQSYSLNEYITKYSRSAMKVDPLQPW